MECKRHIYGEPFRFSGRIYKQCQKCGHDERVKKDGKVVWEID